MRYDGPDGMMLDLVGPSPDGVDLEWVHPYTGVNPYTYANNNPIRFVDPSGLQAAIKPKMKKSKKKNCIIFARQENIAGDDCQARCARACRCMHVDVASTCAPGIIRIGFGGGVGRGGTGVGIPMDENDIALTQKDYGTLGAGKGKGTPCVKATYAQIVDCIKSVPKPPKYDICAANCQTDVTIAIRLCCLTGYGNEPYPPDGSPLGG